MGVAKRIVTQMLTFITQMLSTLISLIISGIHSIIIEKRKKTAL